MTTCASDPESDYGSEEIQSWRLALSDSVGHIFLLRVPLPKADLSAEQQTIELLSLWDGHREPIFHISVDPFSERVATHSTEGELLIWDKVDIGRGRRQSISRKMDLDDSNIRTIAWAPTESEFIAATSKKVYRMMYDAHAEVWSPCSASLPNIKPYDRIFTYPANPIDTIQESHHKPSQRQPYYISTVDSKSKTVQTWYVPSSENGIEFVNSTTLSTGPRFDRVSRVMPVPYPFFSRDNIMATFDTESGKLRIWGIRTSPDLFWFCSKEHRLPCMNVEMIRYNSIDKAAIVSTEADGSVIVTVWVFSSASRASHYLPAGTIYPRSKTDRVREIRWHLTDYAQTYLGIQWDDRIDIYCQERNVDDAWMRVFTISASDFGPEKKIGSFSFTAAGEPTFSIGCKMIACTQTISDGRQLEQVAYEEHGQLPLIHPFVLTELMSWGRVDVAKRLLAQLYDYMREKAIDGTRKVALPTVSMQDLVSPVDSSNSRGAFSGLGSTKKGASGIMSRYSALFGASAYDDATQGLDAETPDFSQLTRDKADYILEKLAEIKIEGISPIDQARLMSIVGTISASLTKDQPIDEMGIRYLVKLQLLELENKRTRSAEGLPYRELNWAMHSSSQAIILQLCLQQQQQQHSSFTGLTWDSARRMGLFVWLSDISVLVSEVEKMARNMFVVEGRDPSRCGIFYLALRKQRLLHGLWRTAHTHAEHSKMVAFMAHDFSEQRWKTAAAKNAYVLLSRQRYLDAATFFLLSDKLSDAATICITQLKDVQMAITICRCYEGDNGPVLKSLLWKHVLPDAFKRQDRWLASLAFGLIGKYDLVLQSLTDDLARLAKQVDVCAEISGYSTMDVLDTELLILYRSMLNHSPYYRAPLVTQAELIAQTITIFECLGAPVMSLVVLEWWRRELFEISKRSQPTLKTLGRSSTLLSQSADSPTTDSLSSGVLDPGAMGIFAGFSSTGSSKPPPAPPKQPAAADPLSSGMLSIDSFGSMFSGRGASRPKASKEPANADALALPQQKQQSQNGNHASAPRDDAQDAALAVDIEDTPVQYACRTALALQIIEFVVKSAAFSKKCSTPRAFEIAKEKQAVAKTLRLPLSVFPTSS
ncbi:regulator of (H+)-ATPase in vacuolar membrane [Coemansia sp. Benny D115]|nr:regulator of (H+)-ATPase in vacuolar membrane [Coemansia sp. Benny D115]